MPLGELVDFAAEAKRLTKERDDIMKKLTITENKLNNPGFLAKAPEAVIEEQKAKAVVMRERIALIDQELSNLK